MKHTQFCSMSPGLLILLGLLPLLLLTTGCSATRMYHEAHGFSDANPQAYENDLSQCKEEAYARFPPLGYPSSFSGSSFSFESRYPRGYYGPRVYHGPRGTVRHSYRAGPWGHYGRGRPYGVLDSFARAEAEREEDLARQEAAEAVRDYNRTRREAVRACMHDKGWREVESGDMESVDTEPPDMKSPEKTSRDMNSAPIEAKDAI